MSIQSQVFVFGEVLFDSFPSGEEVLGGAPFNIAWHLQAFGDQPQFISRIGDDLLGKKITTAITGWGMVTSNIQYDDRHKTGRVKVNVIDNEPHYDIVANCAYDFIDSDAVKLYNSSGILYHGSLALRNDCSRHALMQLAQNPNMSIFLDVNLRSPWWEKQHIETWLDHARWVKLNIDELALLGFNITDLKSAMEALQSQFQLEQVIVTCGPQGAIVLSEQRQFHQVIPQAPESFIDTVGAGDAFTAIYIHGLLSGWSILHTLELAQQFACKVIGLRGAVSTDSAFYRNFID